MADLAISQAKTGPHQDITLVQIHGLIDTNTAGDLGSVISKLILNKQYRVIVDLGDVHYVSSAGWGLFIGELHTFQRHQGDLKLARLTPDVEEVYKMLEFYNILKAYDSVDDAIRDFA